MFVELFKAAWKPKKELTRRRPVPRQRQRQKRRRGTKREKPKMRRNGLVTCCGYDIVFFEIFRARHKKDGGFRKIWRGSQIRCCPNRSSVSFCCARVPNPPMSFVRRGRGELRQYMRVYCLLSFWPFSWASFRRFRILEALGSFFRARVLFWLI